MGNKGKKEAAKAAKDALNLISPEEFMKKVTIDDGDRKGMVMYTAFGDDGMPTHGNIGEVAGEELNKNQKKKVAKQFGAQQKKYEKRDGEARADPR